MTDFDDYEYLEKTAGAEEAGVAANGREKDKDRDRDLEPEEEAELEDGPPRRRSRSAEGGSRRERDVEDGGAVRERERSKERGEGDREREKERGREHRSRDRDRDRDRERERDADRDRGRDRRHRERDTERRGRSREREHHRGRRQKDKEEEPEADPERDQRTVFAYQINLKADERDVYEFFSRAGKVRDVRLIMDRNSRRSKGVGYIEFYDAMSVPMAIALRGQLLLGTPVMVKPSEAEKNLAAQQAAIPTLPIAGVAGVPGAGFLLPQLASGSRRLLITNLHQHMNDEQLKQVVEPFGALDSVQVVADPVTKQCKGSGFVMYTKLDDARTAQQYLNDMEVAGLKIKVQFIPENITVTDNGPPINPGELDDDEGRMAMNAQSRVALMQKLDRTGGALAPGAVPGAGLGLLGTNPLGAALQPGLLGGLPGAPALPGVLPGLPGLGGVLPPPVDVGIPSEFLLLKNMFTSSEEMDDEFEQDIREDVEAECEKFGKVLSVHVDRKVPGGQVYVKFAAIDGATQARQALHNRWFAGKPISATFMNAAEFAVKVGL